VEIARADTEAGRNSGGLAKPLGDNVIILETKVPFGSPTRAMDALSRAELKNRNLVTRYIGPTNTKHFEADSKREMETLRSEEKYIS